MLKKSCQLYKKTARNKQSAAPEMRSLAVSQSDILKEAGDEMQKVKNRSDAEQGGAP